MTTAAKTRATLNTLLLVPSRIPTDVAKDVTKALCALGMPTNMRHIGIGMNRTAAYA